MHPRTLGYWLVLGLAVVALSVPGAYAGSFTYTYTGFEFGDAGLTNNVGGDIYQFLATDSVTATVVLDAAIPSDSSADYVNDPDFTPDLLSWSITAGGLTLSSTDPNATLQQLSFATTGADVTFWEMYANGAPASAPADLSYASIITINDFEAVYDEGFLDSNGSGSNNGEIDLNPGSWSNSESPSVPEPATITMLIGGLTFLGKKRLSDRRASR
jgi:hypothetical protein